jgi:hypothetical protein
MIDRGGEPMSAYTAHRDVFHGSAGALQHESIGDLGWRQALGATGELERVTVHCLSSS